MVERDDIRLQVWKAVTASGGTVDDARLEYATNVIMEIIQNSTKDK